MGLVPLGVDPRAVEMKNAESTAYLEPPVPSIAPITFLTAVAAVVGLLPNTAAAEDQTPAVHPWVVYQAADREAIRAHLHPNGGEWKPQVTDKGSRDPVIRSCYWWLTEGYEGRFDGQYRWEGPKSEAMFHLAMITWIEPSIKRPARVYHYPKWIDVRQENATLPGMVRTAVQSIAVPKYRVRDYFPDNDDPKGKKGPGPWGRYLDGSIALWHYALAYDLLASPQVAHAGLDPQVLDEFYTRIADGAFHLMAQHLATYKWQTQSPEGNNWNSREMAGVGLVCLAMKDRFLAEPAGSQRRQDYETGLRMVRQLASIYLKGWDSSHNDPRFTYYNEGPHYTCYWIQYFLPFAAAHERLFPAETPPEMSLAADQPLARFLRGQTLTIMPTMRDKAGKAVWTAPCLDDSWLEADNIATPSLLAAAWIGQKNPDDRQLFLQAARRGGAADSPLLLGNPVVDELAHTTLEDLPPLVGLPYGGLAVARTSSSEDALAVVLKNTPTPLEPRTGAVKLDSHSHPDNGEVVAYRNAEPVLIDPGYGPNGYGNPDHKTLFTPPQQHNVLMVEDAAHPGQFVLPVYPNDGSHPRRITRCEQIAGPKGPIDVIEAATPAHRRTVILVDASHLLVVDRLAEARKVRLEWFGHGATVDSTAQLDTARAQATFTRGPSLATRVTVLLPGGITVAPAIGQYGFEWPKRDHPLTGITVTSDGPVTHAVTLVEVRSKQPQPNFSLTAQVQDAAGQGLKLVIAPAAGQRPEIFRIAPDGRVSTGE